MIDPDMPEGAPEEDFIEEDDSDLNPLDVDDDLLAKARAAASAAMDAEEPVDPDDEYDEGEEPVEEDLDDELDFEVEEDEDEPDEEPAEAVAEGEDEEPDDDLEALAAEKKWREEAATARQEAREAAAKLAKLQKLAEYDRIALIRELYPDADLAEIGEDFFQASLGEDADDDWKLKQRRRTAQMEVEELEGRKTKAQQAQQQDVVQMFVEEVQTSIKTLDSSQFPALAKLVEQKGDQHVHNKIFMAAQLAAQTTGTVPPTEELIKSIEDEYAVFLPAESEREPRRKAKSKSKPESKGKRKPKSLRNSMQRSRRPRKKWEDMTDDEQQRYRMARARKAAAEAMKNER